MESWIHKSCIMESWDHETKELRDHVIMGLWDHEILRSWDHGSLDRRIMESLEYWSIAGAWDHGTMGLWE
jgi:hypothetical protein